MHYSVQYGSTHSIIKPAINEEKMFWVTVISWGSGSFLNWIPESCASDQRHKRRKGEAHGDMPPNF